MKIRRILPFALLTSFLLIGCGGGEPTDKRILKIEFVKGGFGLTPYEKLAEAFMKEHKDVQVKLVPNPEMASTTSEKLANGSNLSDIFIYNRTACNIYEWTKKGYILDLTSLMNEEVENGQTLLDKLDDNAKKVSEYEGKYWCIPEYYNINGFVYNATLFEANNWSVPKTTKEFKELCEKISQKVIDKKNVKPLVYCGNGADGYLYYGVDGWTYSYEGTTNLDNFYSYSSPEVYNPKNNQGKIKAMETLKEIFFDSGYAVENSMSLGAIEGQSKLTTWEAAMMLNGSWFENEMKDYLQGQSTKFKMFAVPELSDDNNNVLHGEGYTTDSDNRQVINAEFVGNCFIPSKAKNIDDAKEFLKFMSKASSCELYTKYSNAVRPLKYDYSPSNTAYSTMSEFGKSVLEIANNNNLYVAVSKAPVAVINKATLYPQGGYWYKRIYSNPNVYTPSYCVQSDYDYAKKNWNDWVNEAKTKLGE